MNIYLFFQWIFLIQLKSEIEAISFNLFSSTFNSKIIFNQRYSMHPNYSIIRYTRGFLARRRFLNISRSTVLIQAVYRGYRERKKFKSLKKGVLMAQKIYRGKKQREKFKVLKEEMAKRAEIERASKERAKAKQQREEQERTSRAVAGVNHLEIPAELAFIYSKLDGA